MTIEELQKALPFLAKRIFTLLSPLVIRPDEFVMGTFAEMHSMLEAAQEFYIKALGYSKTPEEELLNLEKALKDNTIAPDPLKAIDTLITLAAKKYIEKQKIPSEDGLIQKTV